MTESELIQQPLMLVMPVKRGALDGLKQALLGLDPAGLASRLTKVGTVHTTRFVVLEDEHDEAAKLIVLAMYDGTAKDYIGAFARELREVFNGLFRFIEDTDDKPGEDVLADVDRFVTYVEHRDVKPLGETYRAYPGRTVLDIYEATRPST